MEVVLSTGPGGSESVLSWTDWNDPLAALSEQGQVLFSVNQIPSPSEGIQPGWVVLRRTDGAPAQILGDGTALDLSSDGRWALAVQCSPRCTRLVGLPTGVGQPREIPSHGFETEIRSARWSRDGRSVYAIARSSPDAPAFLYRFKEGGSAPEKISNARLSRIGCLQISSDEGWAAALDQQLRVAVISIQDGTATVLPRNSGQSVPRGWSRRGGLWITEVGPRTGSRTPLLRVDPRTGAVLEERTVGPADPAGAGPVQDVVLSADEKSVVFEYSRRLKTLLIVRGLGR